MTQEIQSPSVNVLVLHSRLKLQPLYSSRWSEETEMDKSLKILKRKQAASIRLRKMNDVYDRLLEGKLKLLSSDFSNLSKELKKETQSIKEEISDNPPKSRFPRIDSVTPSAPSRQPSSTNGRGHGENVCQSCLFDPANTTGRCKHFPCFLPMTYNSIGVFPKPQTYSVVSNYKQLVQRCGDLRPPTSKRQTIIEESAEVNTEQESRAPRTNVKEKIRGLKQLVKEMKERNDKTKPRDWAINYGDPLPRRVILKPVKTA
ncbi:hypothetical protein ACF0H5_003412 [Mactra antiquata]